MDINIDIDVRMNTTETQDYDEMTGADHEDLGDHGDHNESGKISRSRKYYFLDDSGSFTLLTFQEVILYFLDDPGSITVLTIQEVSLSS